MSTEIDTSNYKFGCPEGEWTGQLDGKKWGKASNLILYFTASTGEKYWLSVFQNHDYGPKGGSINFKNEEVGDFYSLKTETNARGNPVLLSAEKCEATLPLAKSSILSNAKPDPN
ncbi:MAG: hypothetical protein WAO98_09810 [Alphaproteobacteria bacterium]